VRGGQECGGGGGAGCRCSAQSLWPLVVVCVGDYALETCKQRSALKELIGSRCGGGGAIVRGDGLQGRPAQQFLCCQLTVHGAGCYGHTPPSILPASMDTGSMYGGACPWQPTPASTRLAGCLTDTPPPPTHTHTHNSQSIPLLTAGCGHAPTYETRLHHNCHLASRPWPISSVRDQTTV